MAASRRVHPVVEPALLVDEHSVPAEARFAAIGSADRAPAYFTAASAAS